MDTYMWKRCAGIFCQHADKPGRNIKCLIENNNVSKPWNVLHSREWILDNLYFCENIPCFHYWMKQENGLGSKFCQNSAMRLFPWNLEVYLVRLDIFLQTSFPLMKHKRVFNLISGARGQNTHVLVSNQNIRVNRPSRNAAKSFDHIGRN